MSKNDSYFLTRQTANLLEDFAREIEQGSSVFLLYGDSSVGKSRLLDELLLHRVSNQTGYRLDYKNKSDSSGIARLHRLAAPDDVSAGMGPATLEQQLEAVEERSLVVVDHFELASNREKHDWFKYWVSDAVDKKINLVMATTIEHFEALRQLAKQYQVGIKSYRLMPFDPTESESFMSFYLSPDSPAGALVVPASERRRLRYLKGNVGKLRSFADNDGRHIEMLPESSLSHTMRWPLLLSVLVIAIIIAAGFVYQYRHDIDEFILAETFRPDIQVVPPTKQEINYPARVKTDVANTDIIAPIIEVAVEKPKSKSVEVLAIDEKPAVVDQAIVEMVDSVDVEIELDQVKSGVVPGNDLLPAEDQNQQHSQWFQRQLDEALQWIKNKDKTLAAIQLMSLNLENFSEKRYRLYLEKLKQEGLDSTLIRIYRTKIGESSAYSVVYGEFENRKEAYKYIQTLSPVLTINKPLARTIGGIQSDTQKH